MTNDKMLNNMLSLLNKNMSCVLQIIVTVCSYYLKVLNNNFTQYWKRLLTMQRIVHVVNDFARTHIHMTSILILERQSIDKCLQCANR